MNGDTPDASKQSSGRKRQPIPLFKPKNQQEKTPASRTKSLEPKAAVEAEAGSDSVKEQSVFARLGSTVSP